MATTAAQEEVFVLYTLDVGFDSSVVQPDPTKPTTMSFAFAGQLADGSWKRLGSETLSVKIDSNIQLGVFDTSEAADPAELEIIEIIFSPSSPFDTGPTITIPPNDPSLKTILCDDSVALDLQAPVGWQTEPLQAIHEGTFQGTIEVSVTTGEGIAKKFCVDPKMIVGGGPQGL